MSTSPVEETKQVTVSRTRLNEFLADPELFRKGARLVPSVRNGETNGIKIYAIRPKGPYAALGLMNGDTVHAIGSFPLDMTGGPELDEGVRAFIETGTATITLAITRRGRRVDLVWSARD